MALDIERAEETQLPTSTNVDTTKLEDATPPKRKINWLLIVMNVTCIGLGTIGGPLMVRLYFLHGGSKKWLSSWFQTAGFPILLVPLSFLYMKHRARGQRFFAEPKLMIASAVIGVLIGLDNFMYSHGLAALPVSTSSLLFSTQLAFTAFFALIIVRQRFTPYSVNAVVLMTLGSVLLGLRKGGDRPANVSNGEYMVGFIITIGAAALIGFVLPCVELAYAKVGKAITYPVVLQFQLGVTFFATVFSTIGMIANKDFSAISREAKAYTIGEAKYYLVIVWGAILFQLVYIGSLGLVFCASSLFTGVVTATLLPLTEIAAVIFFKEKFTGEKGMSLALCLWGFMSYFYGAYIMERKQRKAPEEEPK
ncbi:hypothetical protein AAC387_Pa04g2648 [Persea americana]